MDKDGEANPHRKQEGTKEPMAAFSGVVYKGGERSGSIRVQDLRCEKECRWHEILTTTGLVLILTTAMLSMPWGSSFAGKLYKWVDDGGVTHFSDRRPDASENLVGVLEERELEEPSKTKEEHRPGLVTPARSPIEYAANCTFTIKSAEKIGTGFLLSSIGLAATCRHVVEGVDSPVAVLNDQNEYPVQVITISKKYDLALIQVLAPGVLPFLSLRDAETVVPGDRVFAIGTSAGLQSTVTDGVFTGLRRIGQTEERLIQFSAPVNQGNSGGPLLDAKGKVIGVVSLKILHLNNSPISGVGFAVPSAFFAEEFGYMIR